MAKNGVVGFCPDCDEVIMVDNKTLFFVCPHCKTTASSSEARAKIDVLCADASKVNEVLQLCFRLEKEIGAEVPLQILEKLKTNNPYNEQVAFSQVRLSGYRPEYIRQYLNTFAAAKKTVDFGTEFLDNALMPQYMGMANLFSQYIENKLPIKTQKKYRERLDELKQSYVGRSNDGAGMGLMYIFYTVGAIINVGLLILFILIDLHVGFYLLIALGVFAVELFLLFLHNRNYGNRIGIDDRERVFLIIFISSILVAIAGIPIGAMVKV